MIGPWFDSAPTGVRKGRPYNYVFDSITYDSGVHSDRCGGAAPGSSCPSAV